MNRIQLFARKINFIKKGAKVKCQQMESMNIVVFYCSQALSSHRRREEKREMLIRHSLPASLSVAAIFLFFFTGYNTNGVQEATRGLLTRHRRENTIIRDKILIIINYNQMALIK